MINLVEVNPSNLYMMRNKLELKQKEYEKKKEELNQCIDNGAFDKTQHIILVLKSLHKQVNELHNKVDKMETLLIQMGDNSLEGHLISV